LANSYHTFENTSVHKKASIKIMYTCKSRSRSNLYALCICWQNS